MTEKVANRIKSSTFNDKQDKPHKQDSRVSPFKISNLVR